ncbi:hypothetical protein CBR65_19640 [Cellvibrio sp. PSBB006]|nr:hypothetical protein CBR65_19640 [Cellvibrio sp. PSBB006]
MELDDLKAIWKKEIAMKNRTIDFDKIRTHVDQYDRRTKWSWALELFACAGIIIAVGFGWFSVENPSLLFQIGMAAMIVSAAFVAAKIATNRRTLSSDNWTLLGKINIQIEKREKEEKLLRSIASWYLTPLFIAILLASYGGYSHRTGHYFPDAGLLIYWGACLVLYIGIYYFNQWQVKTRLTPLLAQLYALREQLKDDVDE